MAKPAKNNRITLGDVAAEAGVSVQTASHVLSGNMTVRLPEATRERVRLAAKKVGYRPNRLAQALKSGKTNVICVWMPLERILPDHVRILKTCQRLASETGYDLMIAGLNVSSALSTEGKLPPVWAVDGIISIDAGKAIQGLRQDNQFDDIPAGILGYESCCNTDSVAWDLIGATKSVTQSLINRKLERIIFLTPSWVYEGYPNERRRRGYTEAMQEAGLTCEFLASDAETSGAAEECIAQYLSENKAPQAVVCFNDALAIGAIRGIASAGLSVPKDIKVWGHGDFPEARDFKTSVSSVQAPIEQLVEQIWTWLLERIENPEIEPRFVEMNMKLIERESSLS